MTDAAAMHFPYLCCTVLSWTSTLPFLLFYIVHLTFPWNPGNAVSCTALHTCIVPFLYCILALHACILANLQTCTVAYLEKHVSVCAALLLEVFPNFPPESRSIPGLFHFQPTSTANQYISYCRYTRHNTFTMLSV